MLVCGTVQCPWHGSQFDVRTGEVKAGPAVQAIRTYAVTEDGGQVRADGPRRVDPFTHSETPMADADRSPASS